MSKFIIQYNASEIIVKLSSPNLAKVIIDDAEFTIRSPQLETSNEIDQVVEYDEVKKIEVEEQKVVKYEMVMVKDIELCELVYEEEDDDEFDEDDYEPGDYGKEIYERQYNDSDVEAQEECDEIQFELITLLDKKRKPTKEIIEKIDQYEQALHQKLSHLQNRLDVQSKCCVIFENLQLLRYKLTKRRNIRYGMIHIRSAIIQVQFDLYDLMHNK